ncbi:MAG: hypothetical protein DK304_001189 [Chloroflexi bacterium]|jgi:hypothetical protein|nr:MAG: hypothetical protein DK304_001189 [Chloroflexota bacterium]
MYGLLPLILPLAAIAGVSTVMISLGMIFLAVGHQATIVLGLIITVLVPLGGVLLTRGSEETSR